MQNNGAFKPEATAQAQAEPKPWWLKAQGPGLKIRKPELSKAEPKLWLSGWAKPTHHYVWCATFLRSSILPALEINRIEALDIFEGAVNQEKFISFLHRQIVSSLLISSDLKVLIDAKL